MDFLTRLAQLNFMVITTPILPEIEDYFTPGISPSTTRPGIPQRPYQGLLRYMHATLSSPPSNSDPLMIALEREFFTSLVILFDGDDASADALRSSLPVDLIRALREDAGLNGEGRGMNGDGGMHL